MQAIPRDSTDKDIFAMLDEIVTFDKNVCQIHPGITKRRPAVCGPRPNLRARGKIKQRKMWSAVHCSVQMFELLPLLGCRRKMSKNTFMCNALCVMKSRFGLTLGSFALQSKT